MFLSRKYLQLWKKEGKGKEQTSHFLYYWDIDEMNLLFCFMKEKQIPLSFIIQYLQTHCYGLQFLNALSISGCFLLKTTV